MPACTAYDMLMFITFLSSARWRSVVLCAQKLVSSSPYPASIMVPPHLAAT